MSISQLLLQSALPSNMDEPSNLQKPHLHQPEAALIQDESRAQGAYLNAANYQATLRDTNQWNPAELATKNTTNDPDHAYTFTFANRPVLMEQKYGNIGLVNDEDAPLRNVETKGHIPQYLPIDSAPALPTYAPNPGYVRLPGLG